MTERSISSALAEAAVDSLQELFGRDPFSLQKEGYSARVIEKARSVTEHLASLAEQADAVRRARSPARTTVTLEFFGQRFTIEEEFMSKVALEVRISVDLPLDEFARAEILSGLKAPIEAFRQALPSDHEFVARVIKKRPEKAEPSVKPALAAE